MNCWISMARSPSLACWPCFIGTQLSITCLVSAAMRVATCEVGLGTIESLRPPCSIVVVQIKFKPLSISSAYC
jgi:hypothetical protein